ncbi:hypothetical protein ABPG77_007072 [Micractinium sp. CCAP 211/92]
MGSGAERGDGAAPDGDTAASGASNGRPAQDDKGEDRLTSISKEMANHLRHDPPEGMDGCGFVPVTRLVDKMEQETSPEEVLEAVRQDEKGRYQLFDEGEGEPRVRAVQGHSVPLKNPLHDPICAPEEVPLALHATSPENWEQIQRSGELRRMHRTHVHFASEPRHLRGNDWASVLLQVDLRRAIEAGLPFCRAANGVVLSEGPIPVQFLRPVKLRDLPEDWQREIPNRERLLQEER